MGQTQIQAGEYMGEKAQAAAIKFATIDVVAKHMKATGKKLVGARDKVAIAKRKIAEKKAKDKSSDMARPQCCQPKTSSMPSLKSVTRRHQLVAQHDLGLQVPWTYTCMEMLSSCL